jgi:hypothetical protein
MTETKLLYMTESSLHDSIKSSIGQSKATDKDFLTCRLLEMIPVRKEQN